jgi:hypothetical protein
MNSSWLLPKRAAFAARAVFSEAAPANPRRRTGESGEGPTNVEHTFF